MPLPFESVREQLLRAGIAPSEATRYVVELREHLVDLTARERSAGLDEKTAGERARAMLGTDAQLARTMIDKTPRSLASRAPWAMFALLPVVALIGIMAVTGIAMFRLLAPVHAAWPGGVPNSYTGLIAVVNFLSRFLVGPALAAGCITLALRQRLSSSWIWVGLALIALLSGLLGFRMSTYPNGGTSFGIVTAVLVNGRPNAAATLALVGVRAAMLFALAALAYRVLQTRLSRVDQAYG
jgi:hypothetical protein